MKTKVAFCKVSELSLVFYNLANIISGSARSYCEKRLLRLQSFPNRYYLRLLCCVECGGLFLSKIKIFVILMSAHYFLNQTSGEKKKRSFTTLLQYPSVPKTFKLFLHSHVSYRFFLLAKFLYWFLTPFCSHPYLFSF